MVFSERIELRRADLLDLVSVLDVDVVLRRALAAAVDRTSARCVVICSVADHPDPPWLLADGIAEEQAGQLRSRVASPASTSPDVARLVDPATGGPLLHVPVLLDGAPWAEMLLGDPGRGRFSDADVESLSVLSRVTGVAVRNARTYSLSERRREWVELTARVTESVRPPFLLVDPVNRIVEGACRITRAELAAVLRSGADGEDVAAAHGPALSSLPDLLRELGPRLRDAQEEGELLELPYGERGTLVAVPLEPELAVDGMVLVVVGHGRGRLPQEDRRLLTSFVTHGSLVLDRAVLQQERQQAVVAADRHRIARDLHDVVIQRIFATGLKLKAGQRSRGQDDSYVTEAIRDLDTTTRDIRTTIYDLEHGRGSSLRSEVRALGKEYERVLGFAPVVRIWGPVNSLVDSAVAEQAAAVLREALSNCARHAGAGTCEVDLGVEDGWVSLVVRDDGRGPGSDDGHHSGLRNLRRRAEALGGDLVVEGCSPSGTRLCWRVPLADQPTGGISSSLWGTGSAAAGGQTSEAARDSSTQHAPVASR